jgi:hypothetical protein
MLFPEKGNILVFKENKHSTKTVLTYFLVFIEPINRQNYDTILMSLMINFKG